MHLIRRLTLLLIVWTALFSTLSSAQPQGPDNQPLLQVSLFNDAHLDPATLAIAQARASAIFSRSGIEVEWLLCRPADPADFSMGASACSTLAWPAHLSVRIRPRGLTIAADTFGQAYLDDAGQGVHSNVYFQNLLLGPHNPQLTGADMLGYVLAHELGHLLLGSNSHSPIGLMQPRWDSATLNAAARSGLFFTPAQSALLRSRLSLSPQPFLFSLSAR